MVILRQITMTHDVDVRVTGPCLALICLGKTSHGWGMVIGIYLTTFAEAESGRIWTRLVTEKWSTSRPDRRIYGVQDLDQILHRRLSSTRRGV